MIPIRAMLFHEQIIFLSVIGLILLFLSLKSLILIFSERKSILLLRVRIINSPKLFLRFISFDKKSFSLLNILFNSLNFHL